MRADEILGEVGARLRQLGGEADWLQVFTPDIAQALSRLLPAEYEEFKTLLEGSVLLEGWKLEGLTEKTLDLLVFAVRVRQEKEASAVPLEHCCPGAPGAEGLMVPGGWEVAPGRVAFLGGLPAALGAVYADGRCLDAERGRSYLRLVGCADGEWRLALVRADASNARFVAAVKNLGVFVECPKTLAAYLRSFWSLNWNRLPLVKAPVEGEVVFEAWRDFVEANASRFLGDWGALRKGELLVLPDVLRRFLGGRGAAFPAVLSAWRREGYLVVAEDGLLAPRWFGGRTRRVAVFRASLFAFGEDAEAAGRSPAAGQEARDEGGV